MDAPIEQSDQPATRRYPLRERKPRTDLQTFLNGPHAEKKRKKSPKRNDDDLDKLDALYSWYKWSKCKLAERYDKERNFFPQPGPSNLNYYENDDIVGYYRPVSDAGKSNKKNGATRSNESSNKKATAEKKTPPKTRGRKRYDNQALSPIWQTNSDNSDWEDDIHVQSIYEQSFAENLNVKNSPVDHAISTTLSNYFDWNGSDTKNTPKNTDSFLDATISTPLLSKFMENLKSAASNEANDSSMEIQRVQTIGQCKITPLENTPHRSDIAEALDTHKIPKMIHPIPHYSDPNDLLADNNLKKEIGHTILQLHGNAINDCEEFRSELNVNGLAKWQRELTALPRTRNSNGSKTTVESAGKCRKFFAREQTTKIAPSETPPTHSQAIEWVKERSTNNTKKRSSTSIGDKDVQNPAKVQRQNSVSDKKLFHNNNYQQKNSNVVKQNGSQERDIMSELLAKTELTVTRITRSNSTKKSTASQSSDANHVQMVLDDDDDDDVICLSDNLPTKQPVTNNTFSQVGRLRNRIHLK